MEEAEAQFVVLCHHGEVKAVLLEGDKLQFPSTWPLDPQSVELEGLSGLFNGDGRTKLTFTSIKRQAARLPTPWPADKGEGANPIAVIGVPRDAKPRQECLDTCRYVKLHIKGTNGRWMYARALVDTGFTHALLLSEYKATQLALQRDGGVSCADAVGGSQQTLHRCGSVSVAVCVRDNSGTESHINEHLLECWVTQGTSAPSSTIQSSTLTPTVLDANFFNDCALTTAANSQTSSPAESSTPPAHEMETGVYRISPVRSGKDRFGHDIQLGWEGLRLLKLSIDKTTGDLVCSLRSPDAVL